jgi:cytochrome b involved in lipid metabolism
MNIAKELKIGVLLTIVFIGLVAFGFYSQKSTPNNTISNTPATTEPNQTTSTYSLSDIAKHNQSSDCWFVINKNVYNVTKYASSHPGGTTTITDYCGTDATSAYDSIMKHGTRSNADLAKLLIGTIK